MIQKYKTDKPRLNYTIVFSNVAKHHYIIRYHLNTQNVIVIEYYLQNQNVKLISWILLGNTNEYINALAPVFLIFWNLAYLIVLKKKEKAYVIHVLS